MNTNIINLSYIWHQVEKLVLSNNFVSIHAEILSTPSPLKNNRTPSQKSILILLKWDHLVSPSIIHPEQNILVSLGV